MKTLNHGFTLNAKLTRICAANAPDRCTDNSALDVADEEGFVNCDVE
jgi:hypothetical protein